MWPDAVQFDPVQGTASPVIEALLEGPASAGPVLLLAVGSEAQRSGWGGRAAIALADALGGRGKKVVLADLSLQAPELHDLLDADNEEGLTDVFLFGASLEHITIPVAGRSFRLIPASPFTPDTRDVLAHRRWRLVFEELAQARDQLLVYLPMEQPGATELADRIGRAIVMAAPPDAAAIAQALTEDAEVIAVLAPPVPAAEAAPEAEGAPGAGGEPVGEVATSQETAAAATMDRLADREFEQIRLPKDGAREALIAELRARQRAALMGPPPPMEPLPEQPAGSAAEKPVEPSAEKPAAPPPAALTVEVPTPALFVHGAGEPQPRARRNRGWLAALIALVAVASVAAAAWYVWQTRFALTEEPQPLTQPLTQPVTLPEAIVPLPYDTGSSTVLPFSVAVASYRELSFAQERLDQLGRLAPRLPFYIAPIEVEGDLYYHVLAGPLADSTAAAGLRDTLVARRIKTGSTAREILRARYAFLLGEYAQRDDAEEQQQQAAMRGVPTYIVASTGLDGSPQYTLYAGAYTGPGDAEFMRNILRSAGLPDNLVERTGINRS